MPHIITIPLDPDQFEKAQLALDAQAGASHVADQKSGSVKNHDIDFNYTYDGATLTMDITERHTLKAKIASDEQIKEHIVEMLAKGAA